MKRVFSILALLLTLSTINLAQERSLLLRQPTLSKTHIVFVHAGDLWIAPRTGGEASRLTTGTGTENNPVFSPDGTQIAFTGQYDGNTDVYVVPTTGGVPKRLTYHPGMDAAVDWTRDGKNVIFTSQRYSESGRTAQLFTMPVDGVFPTLVPLPMAVNGSYSPDSTRLAYEPLPRAFGAWKRYRGGRASAIWLANLNDSSVEKLPRTDSNDFAPMWIGNKVYFLSDRNGPVTLFAYDTTTKKVIELLKNDGLDIKSASAGPDAIVYEQFGAIYLFDLKTNKAQKVNITLNGDMPSVRAKYEKVGNRIFNAALSPTGARAIFEARGEVLTVPAEKGDVRNLTNTQGVAERNPSWSPDGKWIAYFSDESGEYALHLRNQTGQGEVKKFPLAPSFYYSPVWSPDSKKIAFADKSLNLWYLDIEKGTPNKVTSICEEAWAVSHLLDMAGRPTVTGLRTSINSSWYNAVFVCSVEDGKARRSPMA
ncbi:MAG: hypothetical protein U0Y68_11535 [Blastocatellia bacterium]